MNSTDGRDSTGRIGLDEIFHVLSDATRRRILAALADEDPRWEDEFATAEFRPEDADRDRIGIELRHVHLPKLAEFGIIDRDRRTGVVTRGENFEEIRPLLELLDGYSGELPHDWP